MITEYVYYPDHDERYAHLSEEERKGYPDEIRFSDSPPIRRVKNFAEMTKEDWKKHGVDGIRFAAKDISVFRAQKWLYP